MYADDMVLISPSAKGLQRLVDICALYGQIHDILFNQDKTVCMYMPSGNHYYLNTPVVILNGIQLAFVRTYKYLGTVMPHTVMQAMLTDNLLNQQTLQMLVKLLSLCDACCTTVWEEASNCCSVYFDNCISVN